MPDSRITYTPHIGLSKLPANYHVWAQIMNDNLTLIDATVSGFIVFQNLRGAWTNSTVYAVQDTVIDTATAIIWQTGVAHTSSSIPTTFADERALYPDRWSGYASPATSGAIVTGISPPLTPFIGQLWYNSDSSSAGGTLYVYYNDGNSVQWVPATPIPGPLDMWSGSGIFQLKQFGAIGDGIADDTAAIQAAITAAAGKTIDGGGLTYKVTATLSGVASNTTLRNMTLDFSTMPDLVGLTDYCLRVDGTVGAAVNLTADTAIGTAVVTVGSTATFVAEQLVFLQSAAVWDSQTSTTYGQYGRVKSIDSPTQITLCDNVVLAFNTADTANIMPVTPVSNVLLDRVNFIGASIGGRLQAAFYSNYSEKLNVVGCEATGFDYVGFGLFRAYKPVVDRCYIRKGVHTTLDYGVGVWGGTFGARISDCTGEDIRHTVTVGQTSGINLYTLVSGCHAINSKDAGFDSHSASMFTTFANNHVEMAGAQFASSSHDGMINEGCHAVFIGNTVVGVKGQGIYYNPTFQSGIASTCMIANNTIILDDVGYGVGSNGVYVLVNTPAGASVSRLVIANNSITGGANNPSISDGMDINCLRSGGTIANVSVTGNQVFNVSGFGCYIRAGAGGTVDAVEVSNNTFDAASTSALYFNADPAGASVANITGGSNVLKASTTGLRLSATTGAITAGAFGKNVCKSPIVNNVLCSGFVNNVIFDDAHSGATTNFATATATLVRGTNYYTFSRGTAQVVTLPPPATNNGYEINLLNSAAQTVDSATANVVPLAGGAAVTAILSAAAGKWVTLRSDSTNWRIVQGN